MKKLLMFAMGFICILATAEAQMTSENKSLSRSEKKQARWANEQVFSKKTIGLTYQNQQNSIVSPLLYSGIGVVLASEKQRFLPKSVFGKNASLRFNLLQPKSGSSTFSGIVQLGAEYMKPVLTEGLYVGGNVQANLNARLSTYLGNNFIQYEAFPSLGMSALYKKSFEIKGRKLGFEASAKMPLVGALAASPRYSYSGDKPFALNFVTLGKMFNPQTAFYINLPESKRFSNKNTRIGYEWNLNRFNRGNDKHLTLATHAIVFSTNLRVK